MVVQIKILLGVVFIVIDISTCFVVKLRRIKRLQAAALLHIQSTLI